MTSRHQFPVGVLTTFVIMSPRWGHGHAPAAVPIAPPALFPLKHSIFGYILELAGRLEAEIQGSRMTESACI